MADETPPQIPHVFLTPKAFQTVAVGAVGLAGVALMLGGGTLVWAGLIVALVASIVVIWLHSTEVSASLSSRRYSKHLNAPIATVALLLILVLVTFDRVTTTPSPDEQAGYAKAQRDQAAENAREIRVANEAAAQARDEFQRNPSSSIALDPDNRDNRAGRPNTTIIACERNRERLLSALNELVYDGEERVFYFHLNPNNAENNAATTLWETRASAFLAKHRDKYLDDDVFDRPQSLDVKVAVLKQMEREASDGLCNHHLLESLRNGTF